MQLIDESNKEFMGILLSIPGKTFLGSPGSSEQLCRTKPFHRVLACKELSKKIHKLAAKTVWTCAGGSRMTIGEKVVLHDGVMEQTLQYNTHEAGSTHILNSSDTRR